MSLNPEAARLVAGASERWRADLFDIGGRNTLLYYRDLRTGTLDLGEAAPKELSALIRGKKVTVGGLFPEEPDRARKSAKAIRKRTAELDEERGIWTCYLAEGMVTWEEEKKTPQAPLLLSRMEVQPAAERGEFTLSAGEEVEVNPALLHVMGASFGVKLGPEDFADLVEADERARVGPVFDRLLEHTASVPGLRMADRAVVGTFSYAKLPMVNDLDRAGELLASHDVVSALSGVPLAQESVRAEQEPPGPDALPPKDEFLVLDADSTQSAVVNAVCRGQHLVVQGPPGTGKSQTIANLLASLTARGRRVLFVAEKRAAIDAVLARMNDVGLGDLVMDIHGGASDKRRIARDLGETLERAGNTERPETERVQHALAQQRTALGRHVQSLHAPREPWGVSAFQAQAALLALRERDSDVRFNGRTLQGLSAPVADQARELLRECVERGGTAPSASVWARAHLPTGEHVRRALESVHGLRGELLPRLRRALETTTRECGLVPPRTPADAEGIFALLTRVREVEDRLGPEVHAVRVERFHHACGTRALRRSETLDPPLTWTQRRVLRKQARGWVRSRKSAKEWERELGEAREVRREWDRIRSDDGTPRAGGGVEELGHAAAQCRQAMTALAEALPDAALSGIVPAETALPELPFQELEALLSRLAGESTVAYERPRMQELQHRLSELGLDPLLRFLSSRSGVDGDTAVEFFDHAWYASVLDDTSARDPEYGAFNGASLDTTVARFQKADTEHVGANARRILRATAENLYRVLDRYPDQTTLLRKQAALRRRHKPVRELIDKVPETLMALKPCWAMSPLVVSQILPARELFDVVVFDEASQIPVADAVPAIMRASTAVVTGDTRQLPPTTFFAGAKEEAEEADELAFTTGFDSILEALHPLLPSRGLSWHYRSRNERLIAFSNAHIYDGSLTTFPGAEEESAVRHVRVDAAAVPGQEESVTAEVQRVVREVLDHARSRPDESLGVITMGINHADRIEAALDRARDDHPDLDTFFQERGREAFFVKNLERVQGDERDAVILSLGYGKGADGRMAHRFGPINQKGGERRLNVAVTRAKRRMTVVSSFGSRDLDPNRLKAEGARLLRRYLEFAEEGGTELGADLDGQPRLNPFEIDVRDRLVAAGIPLVCQYGVAGYRIDFVAAHPEQPGRMVLAIEADGAAYHSSRSARDRDRLRQQQLENLGWTFHRIWSTNWFRGPVSEVAKVKQAYEDAVRNANASSPGGAPRATGRKQVSERESDTGGAGTSGAGGAGPEKEPPRRALPRPRLLPGRPIIEYTDQELLDLASWIESDGLLRTEDEVVREAMAFLEFRRRGNRIDEALRWAVRTARA